MKLLSKILAYAAVPCLAAALLISFIDRLSGDKVWIKREYEKLDINDYTGMSTDEMCAVYLRMVDYMKGGTDELQTEVTVFGERTEMFGEREISHMSDVRKLWFGVETAKYILFAFTAIAAALALYVSYSLLFLFTGAAPPLCLPAAGLSGFASLPSLRLCLQFGLPWIFIRSGYCFTQYFWMFRLQCLTRRKV